MWTQFLVIGYVLVSSVESFTLAVHFPNILKLGAQQSINKKAGKGLKRGMTRSAINTYITIEPPFTNLEKYSFILRTFNGLGYQTTYTVLQAGEFGLPQDRKRAIFVGTLPGHKPPAFPQAQVTKLCIHGLFSD